MNKTLSYLIVSVMVLLAVTIIFMYWIAASFFVDQYLKADGVVSIALKVFFMFLLFGVVHKLNQTNPPI